MARTLILEGRPYEAIPFIKTAMRIDPDYPPFYSFVLGLAQFGLDQFEAAAKFFESATRRNPNYGQALLFLGATYGYLNRKQEAALAIASYNSLSVQNGEAPLTIAAAATEFGGLFLESRDADRLAQGLHRAGVPDY